MATPSPIVISYETVAHHVAIVQHMTGNYLHYSNQKEHAVAAALAAEIGKKMDTLAKMHLDASGVSTS
jgi:hypothetical protein